jgi:hypothetical protein
MHAQITPPIPTITPLISRPQSAILSNKTDNVHQTLPEPQSARHHRILESSVTEAVQQPSPSRSREARHEKHDELQLNECLNNARYNANKADEQREATAIRKPKTKHALRRLKLKQQSEMASLQRHLITQSLMRDESSSSQILIKEARQYF